MVVIIWGKIARSYWVGCGKCKIAYCELFQAMDGKEAQSAAREFGWKKTRRYGYICEDCAEEQKSPPPTQG